MSISNRALRMAQHHVRNRADAELNLIPLIDILSVMVAFLLVYSTEVEVIQNSKGIEIPQSIAQTAPKQSVVVMVTKTDLFVQGEFITTVADIRAAPGPLVEPLRAALQRPLLVGREMTEKDLAQREITIMADKALPYEVLKRVMATRAMPVVMKTAGFTSEPACWYRPNAAAPTSTVSPNACTC